jgi:hypothetical protein
MPIEPPPFLGRAALGDDGWGPPSSPVVPQPQVLTPPERLAEAAALRVDHVLTPSSVPQAAAGGPAEATLAAPPPASGPPPMAHPPLAAPPAETRPSASASRGDRLAGVPIVTLLRGGPAASEVMLVPRRPPSDAEECLARYVGEEQGEGAQDQRAARAEARGAGDREARGERMAIAGFVAGVALLALILGALALRPTATTPPIMVAPIRVALAETGDPAREGAYAGGHEPPAAAPVKPPDDAGSPAPRPVPPPPRPAAPRAVPAPPPFAARPVDPPLPAFAPQPSASAPPAASVAPVASVAPAPTSHRVFEAEP